MLNVTIDHINELLEKQNYTNLYLIILGEEFSSLKEEFNSLKRDIKEVLKKTLIQENEEKTSKEVIFTSPSMQPHPAIKKI